VVGRRTAPADPLQAGFALQSTAVELHKSLGHRWLVKGVYRFTSHEEADKWMWTMLTTSQAKTPKTT
jgi:hypothetical protein